MASYAPRRVAEDTWTHKKSFTITWRCQCLAWLSVAKSGVDVERWFHSDRKSRLKCTNIFMIVFYMFLWLLLFPSVVPERKCGWWVSTGVSGWGCVRVILFVECFQWFDSFVFKGRRMTWNIIQTNKINCLLLFLIIESRVFQTCSRETRIIGYLVFQTFKLSKNMTNRVKKFIRQDIGISRHLQVLWK